MLRFKLWFEAFSFQTANFKVSRSGGQHFKVYILSNILDFVVQVVDARRPLLYRCADVEKYVTEVAARQGEEKGIVF